jgi:DNA polymerase eta
LDYYRRESTKIINIFQEGLPSGEIGTRHPHKGIICLIDTNVLFATEKASIDEAFIDFTRPVREIILERFPYLACVPPDGIDTPLPPPPPISWDGLGAIVPIFATPEGSEGKREASPDENHLEDEDEVREGSDELTSWHDMALSIAAELMERIREEVRTKLGYTTSAVSAVLIERPFTN